MHNFLSPRLSSVKICKPTIKPLKIWRKQITVLSKYIHIHFFFLYNCKMTQLPYKVIEQYFLFSDICTLTFIHKYYFLWVMISNFRTYYTFVSQTYIANHLWFMNIHEQFTNCWNEKSNWPKLTYISRLLEPQKLFFWSLWWWI